jgi:hypothetical protein
MQFLVLGWYQLDEIDQARKFYPKKRLKMNLLMPVAKITEKVVRKPLED